MRTRSGWPGAVGGMVTRRLVAKAVSVQTSACPGGRNGSIKDRVHFVKAPGTADDVRQLATFLSGAVRVKQFQVLIGSVFAVAGVKYRMTKFQSQIAAGGSDGKFCWLFGFIAEKCQAVWVFEIKSGFGTGQPQPFLHRWTRDAHYPRDLVWVIIVKEPQNQYATPILGEMTDTLRLLGNSCTHATTEKISESEAAVIDDFFE